MTLICTLFPTLICTLFPTLTKRSPSPSSSPSLSTQKDPLTPGGIYLVMTLTPTAHTHLRPPSPPPLSRPNLPPHLHFSLFFHRLHNAGTQYRLESHPARPSLPQSSSLPHEDACSEPQEPQGDWRLTPSPVADIFARPRLLGLMQLAQFPAAAEAQMHNLLCQQRFWDDAWTHLYELMYLAQTRLTEPQGEGFDPAFTVGLLASKAVDLAVGWFVEAGGDGEEKRVCGIEELGIPLRSWHYAR